MGTMLIYCYYCPVNFTFILAAIVAPRATQRLTDELLSVIPKDFGLFDSPADDMLQSAGSVYASFARHIGSISYCLHSATQKNNAVPIVFPLEQSFDLQKILEKIDPDSLTDAFEKARIKGPGWRKRVDDGLNAMRRLLG